MEKEKGCIGWLVVVESDWHRWLLSGRRVKMMVFLGGEDGGFSVGMVDV